MMMYVMESDILCTFMLLLDNYYLFECSNTVYDTVYLYIFRIVSFKACWKFYYLGNTKLKLPNLFLDLHFLILTKGKRLFNYIKGRVLKISSNDFNIV